MVANLTIPTERKAKELLLQDQSRTILDCEDYQRHLHLMLIQCFHNSTNISSVGWFYNPHPEYRFHCCEGFYQDKGMCKPKQCLADIYGQDCRLSCPDRHYGINCLKKCSCRKTEVCHKISGCICKDGFIGPKCKQSCQSGRHGKQCKIKCSCPAEYTCYPGIGKCNCGGDLIKGICIAASTIQLYNVDSTSTMIMDATATNEQFLTSLSVVHSSKNY
ncbi:unnamed protein product [Mytilus coruscus]|uniref:MEGF10_11 n=1 Tax=Mytilus coruscus TaxID=42192 RepID=A0A6J8CHE4_MYTCO|nr:unnamed protein product [Mytilus coruscus]